MDNKRVLHLATFLAREDGLMVPDPSGRGPSPQYIKKAVGFLKALKSFDDGAGVRCVPVEPTPAMIAEMESAASIGIGHPYDEEAIPRVWRYALEASTDPYGV